MKARRRLANPRLVKINRSYTIFEVARLFGIHRVTVRRWIASGLPTIDDARPTLILGRALQRFVSDRRLRNKCQCELGQLYCLKCRAPRRAKHDEVLLVAPNERFGRLIATCSVCGNKITRLVSLRTLGQFRGILRVHRD